MQFSDHKYSSEIESFVKKLKDSNTLRYPFIEPLAIKNLTKKKNSSYGSRWFVATNFN